MNGTYMIERIGKTTGRWPRYHLIVDGVNLGLIRRTVASSGDRLSPHVRYDAWQIHGEQLETRDKAEARLIELSVRFGKIPSR